MIEIEQIWTKKINSLGFLLFAIYFMVKVDKKKLCSIEQNWDDSNNCFQEKELRLMR